MRPRTLVLPVAARRAPASPRGTSGRARFAPDRAVGRVSVLLSLLVAAHAGVTIVGVVREHAQALSEARAALPRETRVLVAAQEIPMGRTIEPQDLVLAPYREALLAPTVHRRVESVVGRVAAERILAGDLVREERLAAPGAGTALNAIVATGMRAESLDLSDSASVSGWLQPGDRVDVISTFEEAEGAPSETTTILRNVRVLSVDDELAREKIRGVKIRPQVTVEVGPHDAQRLTAAVRGGRLRLTLRGIADAEVVSGG